MTLRLRDVRLPDLDLARFRDNLPAELGHLQAELSRIPGELGRIDLPHELGKLDLHRELAKHDLRHLELPHVDLGRSLSHLDMPGIDLARLTGHKRKRRGPLGLPPVPLALGVVALIGGLAFGGVMAWLFDPRVGAKRRRWLKRKLGMAPAPRAGAPKPSATQPETPATPEPPAQPETRAQTGTLTSADATPVVAMNGQAGTVPVLG